MGFGCRLGGLNCFDLVSAERRLQESGFVGVEFGGVEEHVERVGALADVVRVGWPSWGEDVAELVGDYQGWKPANTEQIGPSKSSSRA